ncbi:hypothetical protein AGABI1DRAFT_134981 [Agaricus bisporus var. burnettii JB137-S8]|uniref:Uncharacterized protein n=1 Tax=Agaricus bisporus var. burnettii (strain JB137-S8 / ATCC MYA-4627 / FGSC 10392) TaxID=597362 RepID=K5WS38_AGABU|nr:uncharacterized protein AGABI1DRAFT_134981 [Agaricus bisporus var. burnettii JB137-S8]EKM73352.1 hypothetical protein AGABI1DRAFT_134981 [Agaricus bisporus var. burnettii JB137-S8]
MQRPAQGPRGSLILSASRIRAAVKPSDEPLRKGEIRKDISLPNRLRVRSTDLHSLPLFALSSETAELRLACCAHRSTERQMTKPWCKRLRSQSALPIRLGPRGNEAWEDAPPVPRLNPNIVNHPLRGPGCSGPRRVPGKSQACDHTPPVTP